MKRTTLSLTFLLLLLATFASQAAGAPDRFIVQSVSLTRCVGALIEGQIQLAVVDADGVVLNSVVGSPTTVYATHSNGPVSAVSWSFIAGQSYQFAFLVAGANVTSVSMSIALNGTAITAPTIVVNCDGAVQIGTPSVGGPAAGDARLNAFNCDLTAALYATSSGISVWDIQPDSKGIPMGVYTVAMLGEFADSPPAVNTIIGSIGKTTGEVLTTGEIQIKIGPDASGKVCTMVADALPPSSVYFLP